MPYINHMYANLIFKFAFLLLLNLIATNLISQNVKVSIRPNGKTIVVLRDTIQNDAGPIYIDTVINVQLPPQQPLQQNYLGKSLMTPTAWPAQSKGGVLFAGLGGTFPQLYTSLNDLIGVVGLSAGNPDRFVSATVMLNINDVYKFRHFSSNIILYKNLPNGSALSAGGIHLLSSKQTDSDPSYYIVFSHAVQTLLSKRTGTSALSYSIGIGSGRFYDNSPWDIRKGKAAHGSAVFANVSLEITKWLNTNVEWSGTNLHAGVSVRPLGFLPSINMGLADITRFSGQEIRFVASINYSIYLWK